VPPLWFRNLRIPHDSTSTKGYLEAEFFGGIGGQTSAGWHNQELIFEVMQTHDAINQALRWLGVLRNNQQDEFDMIELGQHRATESWAQQ
jgi:hypothetical protein